jgi:hypothetical protein
MRSSGAHVTDIVPPTRRHEQHPKANADGGPWGTTLKLSSASGEDLGKANRIATTLAPHDAIIHAQAAVQSRATPPPDEPRSTTTRTRPGLGPPMRRRTNKTRKPSCPTPPDRTNDQDNGAAVQKPATGNEPQPPLPFIR